MRWRLGEGRAVGSLALFLSLVTHASPPDERTLWRWSYPDAAILGVVALIFMVTLLGLLRPATGPIDGGYRPPASRIAAHWIDLGWFLWGLGYLIGSAFLPSSRGRLFDLDLLGSPIPGASFLEWGGAVALVIALGVVIWQRVGRRSWPLAALLLLPLIALVAGESWARWMAMYRPRVTAIPSTTDARWHRLHARVDADGFRDSSHTVAKREGSSRILLVGDEAAFGEGIADPGDRLSELLALRLGTATGRPWESINVARPGTHTKDHLAILGDALRFSPDAVVLLYSFDDIAYFAPVARAELLALHPRGWTERAHPLRVLYRNSVLLQEGYLWTRHRYPERTGGGPLPIDPYADASLVAAHLEEIQAFVQRAEEAGAATLLVPFDVEVGSDPARRSRYRSLVAAATAAEIPVLAVDSGFAGRPLGQFVLDTLDRRPNALAHRVTVEPLARRLIAVMGLGAPGAPPPTP